jgi:hypothetical protein
MTKVVNANIGAGNRTGKGERYLNISVSGTSLNLIRRTYASFSIAQPSSAITPSESSSIACARSSACRLDSALFWVKLSNPLRLRLRTTQGCSIPMSKQSVSRTTSSVARISSSHFLYCGDTGVYSSVLNFFAGGKLSGTDMTAVFCGIPAMRSGVMEPVQT